MSDDFLQQLKFIMEFKAKMLADKCFYGKITCPKCDTKGALIARISRYNNHIHCACETQGCLVMME